MENSLDLDQTEASFYHLSNQPMELTNVAGEERWKKEWQRQLRHSFWGDNLLQTSQSGRQARPFIKDL